MKRRKPRGPVPSLIGGTNGRPKRVTVKKKSKCSRCHVSFVAGNTCISIPKVGGAYSSAKRVCDGCYQGILEKTAEEFEKIKEL